ncbi:MAG TPA: hypothetical protein VK824_08675, partial [Planctomycetota bacterium]|nr:hypothetical protein [Planctomycetota bacterium]
MKCLLAAFASLLMLTGGASAGTIHVPGDALTIQGAIVMATSGDTILVAPGAYVEEIDLLGKQLVIEGTGGAAVTTIDANGQGRTVTVNTGEPAGTRLAGFTITGGTGGIVNLGELTSNCGGGLYVGSGAHLDLSDCMVTGNSVGSSGNSVGGGMAAHQSTVTVTGCTFSGNTGQRGAAFSVPTGGTLVAV